MLKVDNFNAAVCLYCQAPANRSGLCAGCTSALPWLLHACPTCALPQNHPAPCPRCLKKPPPFDSAWAAFRLETPVQEAIHRLKYGAGFMQGRMLGELMAQQLARRAAPMPEVIIPVPLHRSRLIRRGYNQALELARILQHTLAIDVAPGLARSVRRTADQIGQTRAQRQRNLRDSFVVDPGVAGRHIALLDDVMTTGATLSELARTARGAGAARIEAWALARVP